MSRPLTVSLVVCPCWGRESPPLSISLLGGILRAHGIKTHLFDLNNDVHNQIPHRLRENWNQERATVWTTAASAKAFLAEIDDVVERSVERILATGSNVVGFSVLGSTLHFTEEMIRRVKAARPETVIILGGVQTSKYDSGKRLIANDCVDAIVTQEGDETLPEALRDLAETGSFRQIPGLIFKRDGAVVDGGPRPPIRSLDALPFADYSDFDLDSYAKPRRLDIFSSRSCVMRCHYCSESTYFERYRFRSGRNLFDEVVHQLARHPHVTDFNFSDSVLNGSIPALREFCELIVAAGIKIGWGGQAVIRKEMTADLLQLMHRAGCAFLGYGVESGSDAVLQSMNKKMSSVALASRVIRDTYEAGIRAYANFMFGYPTETEADFLATLKFVKDNRPWLDGVSPAQSFMVLQQNTYLYDHLDQFGIDPGAHSTFWKTRDGTNTYPIRFQRYEMFCKLCLDLVLDGGGVVAERTDKWAQLGAYHRFEGDDATAYRHYRTQLLTQGYDAGSAAALRACGDALGLAEETRAFMEVFNLTAEAAAQVGPVQCTAHATDHNWLLGVARGWATAFFVAYSEEAEQALAPGNEVEFADGSRRGILSTRRQESSLLVELEGEPLDGRVVGYPHKFRIHPPSAWERDDGATFQLMASTDHNWLNGVARDWAAAFFLPTADTRTAAIAIGDAATFHDGTCRSVVDLRAEGGSLVVFLDGPPLDGAMLGHPNRVTLSP